MFTIWSACVIISSGTRSFTLTPSHVFDDVLADSCVEVFRDLEKEHDPDLVRRRAAEFAEDVRHYSRLIELT